MPTRNSDGRFRNHNKPTVVSADTLRAQWVEMEAMRPKRNGFSYEAIAEQITQVGRGQKVPVTPLPEGIHFPPDYKITAMGCHKAVQRALRRAPPSKPMRCGALIPIAAKRCTSSWHLAFGEAIRKA
jgi:hypothetical protein